ncbi:DNA polymerase III subunit gamma/tau [Francisellaceae bacterium]|nr:DNA polymerase III subunit gamma/tau [Francisellaceae bacterium]
MSYQVLARKYRPKHFSEVVGQQHVLLSLEHSLDSNRLHHAYLFTGTRGVGKTSLARLLVKCLNCEKGVSSKPCDKCNACVSINEGKFVDLIEIDAASRTKVEDTRDILDNVQYMPTVGRYKVYLIDEVHMLSIHSFNALLKTLEEPPEHVKFLLATTDPQKLPVTILSRCLQFHLKNLTSDEIVGQLANILGKEEIQYEQGALSMLAKAASGSMRDSLSLLDQAINHAQGQVSADSVANMLGVVDHRFVLNLMKLVLNKDIQGLAQETDQIVLAGKSGVSVLNNLAELLFCVQSFQLGGQVPMGLLPENEIKELAVAIHPEYCQLLYQIAIKSKEDILLAPDEKIGLDMALLRMVAFNPSNRNIPVAKTQAQVPMEKAESLPVAPVKNEMSKTSHTATPNKPEVVESATESSGLDWNALVAKINLKGVTKQIIRHSLLESYDGKSVKISLDPVYQGMLTEQIQKRIELELGVSLGNDVTLVISGLENQGSKKKELTPAQVEQNATQKLLDEAYSQLKNNEIIQQLSKGLDVEIDKEQIFLKK